MNINQLEENLSHYLLEAPIMLKVGNKEYENFHIDKNESEVVFTSSKLGNYVCSELSQALNQIDRNTNLYFKKIKKRPLLSVEGKMVNGIQTIYLNF